MALRPNSSGTPSNPATDHDQPQQDGFLREVDEALREQELFELIRKYGKPLGAAIAALLLGLGGYLWWDHSQKQAAGELSEKTILALEKLPSGGAAVDATLKDLEPLTKEGSAASQANARMIRAAIAMQQGKAEDAARDFAAIAADNNAPQPFRDMATIRELAIRFDKLPPQQVVDRLKPLAVPGNPWFGSAGELTGMALLKLNKPALAGAMFAAVAKDKDVPQSLRARMRQISGQLGIDTGEDLATAAPVAAN